MAKTLSEAVVEEEAKAVPFWKTTVKLGAIDEAKYAEPGDVVVAVDKASGELTLGRSAAEPPYGRSTGG